MCWSETATYSMVGLGAAATLVTYYRKDSAAIWGTLGYFTAMEALQAWGYAVIDQCGTPSNFTVTLLSYLHIAFQPLVINAFCMALLGTALSPAARRRVFALAGLATFLMLARLVPMPWAGTCQLGTPLCGPGYCTVSGGWHLGWTVPLNDLLARALMIGPLVDMLPVTGGGVRFLDYMLAVFLLPCFYGAWRFALFHLLLGPVLATLLTGNANEAPAVWCLFSIGLALSGISPLFRRSLVPPRPAPA